MGERRGRGEGSVEKLPSGSYRAVVSLGRDGAGNRRRAAKTFKTKREALEWRDTAKAAGPSSAMTLGEWLDLWLPLHEAAVAPSNYRTDKYTVEKQVRPGLGAKRLRDLDALACRTWLAGLAGGKVGRHKAGRTLRKVLNAAVELKQLAAAPRFKVPRMPAPRTHALEPLDLGRLVVAADRAGRGPGAMVRVWADAGPRPAELFGFHWADWHPARRVLQFRRAVCRITGAAKELKTEQSRRDIEVGEEAAAALEAYRPKGAAADAPIWPSPEGAYWDNTNFNRRAFGPLAKAAGVACTPKTLRHTCATLLLRAGVGVKVVSERLGHADVATTLRVYAHVLGGMQAQAAAVMTTTLREAVELARREATAGRESHTGPTGDD